MRIAFVSANREHLPDPVIPLGLLYVLANTPPEHETVLWDLAWEDDPHGLLATRLAEWRPDLVAIGLRNVQNSDYSGTAHNLAAYDALMATVRRATPAPVVVGGGAFSVLPEGMMRRLRPEFGIVGEGEDAFRELLGALGGGAAALRRVPRLHWWDGDVLVINPPSASFFPLDRLVAPDRRRVDPRHYARTGTDSVQTKRGCAMRCSYCTYPRIEGAASRLRSPEAVVDELVAAREAVPDLRHVFVVDAVFNLPPSHAKAVCRAMIRRGYAVPWTCYGSPLGFDEELATLMAEAGCVGLEIGADSGCDTVLARLGKGFTTASLRTMHERCRRVGLKDCFTFVLGTDGETLDDVERSLDFLADVEPHAAIVMAWTDDEDALHPERNADRRAFREAVLARVRARLPQHRRWIVPSLGVNFDARRFAALRRSGMDGPLWQHLPGPRPRPAAA